MKTGAMALFGEKYGEMVRVVTIDPLYSIELCGGTHVGATGELGYFKIRSESAVAAGVRRIEAVGGSAAEKYIDQELSHLSAVRDQLKNPKELVRSLQDLQTENSGMRKKIESMEMKQAVQLKISLANEVSMIGKYAFIGQVCEGVSPDTLRMLGGEYRHAMPNLLIILAIITEGKPFVVVGLGDRLIAEKNLNASKIIKEIVAPLIKGGGGGQNTLATAGGQDASALESVFSAVRVLLG
jgi:alanyl-tRNA synthetase